MNVHHMPITTLFFTILISFLIVVSYPFCRRPAASINKGLSTTESSTLYRTVALDSASNITPGLFAAPAHSSSAENSASHSPSLLDDVQSLRYYYEAADYCYGITADGREVFAHLNADGSRTDVIQGGGTITLRDPSDQILCQALGISQVEVLEDAPANGVRVTYHTSLEGTTFTTTYRFYEYYVKSTASLNSFPTTAPVGVAFLERTFPNGFVRMEQKLSSSWIFPQDNDFPYKEFDSYVTVHAADSVHELYTFFHGEDANIREFYEYYPKEHFLLKTENQRLTHSEVNYELVFENREADRDCSYFALFKSRGYPLTLGITPTQNTACGSSVFTDADTMLNVNVSNMESAPIHGNLTFHLYDYYGNDLLNDTLQIALEGKTAWNRLIKLSDFTGEKSGIYYLDITLTDGIHTSREFYPFALLSGHTFQYRQSNPFGISGVRFGEYEANDTTVYLASVLGISHARVGISLPEYAGSDYALLKKYLEKLRQNGVRIYGQFLLLDGWKTPSDADSYSQALTRALSGTGSSCFSAVELGNEPNIIDVPFNQFDSLEASMDHYVSTQFLPGTSVLKSFGIPVMPAGVGLSNGAWLELLDRRGILDASDILSTHAYSYPYSPDLVKDPGVENSFESALVRVRGFLDRTGDKPWHVSEMGLPTTPLPAKDSFRGVGLRTQADYGVREYLLALAYGADVVNSYSLYDQQNLFKGFDNQNHEFHFGMFYDQDYYGRILPKPYGAAYAAMTRQLDGVTAVEEISSSSGTLRVFQITLADNRRFLAAYSNASRLSDDGFTGTRTPSLPWQNQWPGCEYVSFIPDAPGAQVYTIDLMGNRTDYAPSPDGTVSLPVSGSPVFIYNGSLP